MPGRLTSTVRADPGVRPVSRSGATRPFGTVAVPSGATSASATNRVASPLLGAVIRSDTVDPPTTSRCPLNGLESNLATCPGMVLNAESPLPPSAATVLSRLPSTGRVVTAEGLPPAGASTVWAAPLRLTS